MRYNKWTILHKTEGNKCLAKCDCGNECEVYICNVKSGKSKQCIKCQAEAAKKRTLIPNFKTQKEPLYYVYQGIKRRCYNKNQQSYKYYGAIGIIMCDEWYRDFRVFYNWAMSNGWKKGMAISRKNDVGNYAPDNCEIKTMSQNSSEVAVPIMTTEKRRKASQQKSNMSSDDIQKLLSLCKSGDYMNKELADMFGINRHTVQSICELWNVVPSYRHNYLSAEQMMEIKEMKNSGLTYKQIAKAKNLAVDTVFRIIKNKRRITNKRIQNVD